MEEINTSIRVKVGTIYTIDAIAELEGSSRSSLINKLIEREVGFLFNRLSQNEKNIVLLKVQDKLEGRNRE